MKIAKKALSILMAVAMLVNIFAVLSFAITPDTAIDLTLSTDKDSYQAGEVVTFTLSIQTIPEITELGLNGNYAIGYNSKAIAPIGAVDDLAAYNIVDIAGGYDDTISGVFPITSENATGEVDTQYGWDAGYILSLADDGTKFSANEKKDLISFQMKLADDVADGDYIVGFNAPSYVYYDAYVNGYFGANGADSGLSTANTFGYGYTTIHVSSAPVVTGPSVAKARAQVKFTPDATAGNGVADKFQFRVKSVISAEDWNTYFYNTANDAVNDHKLTAVGLIAFPEVTDGDTSFDKALATEAANAAISNPDYTGVAGEYKAASTTYINKAEGDNTPAYFGAIINISHETCKSNVMYLGFAQYNDADGNPQIIFYDAAIEANVCDGYNGLVETYKQTYSTLFPAQ